MSTYNIIAASNESTVVAEYTPESSRSDSFQSEAALEKEFIRMLTAQGYEYLTIHDENSLIVNLRQQLELLNDYTFTDSEWKRFFTETLANANEGIVEKSRTIQTDHVKVLRRDDGTSKNIQLIDKKNIHNNRLQVINQYKVNGSKAAREGGLGHEETEGKHDTRYDVTILVNGLPLVHVELKRRGAPIREAFNQIKRYQRDSFWAGKAACMSMCRFSLFPMERTPNIIPTPLETATSRKWASLQNRNLRKQAIALSLLLSGQMVTIR